MSLVLTPIATDNFQRANESPLSSPWGIGNPTDNGSLQVVSNLCESQVDGVHEGGQLYNATTPADQYASATVNALGGGFIVYVRLSADFKSAGYFFEVAPNGNPNSLWQLVAIGNGGTFLAGGSLTLNDGDVLSIAAVGSTIYVFQNSTQLASVTNAEFSSGQTGLDVFYTSSPSDTSVSKFVMGSAATAYDPTKIFIGSVRVVGSVPAGPSNPFLGTVSVIGSAPAGESNPYLGSVAVLSQAPAGPPNVSEGQVVVVGSAPAGVADPFLGSVIES